MTKHRLSKLARLGNRHGTPMRLARGLGWLSVGLGALQVIAPHALARFLGMRGSEGLLQTYGARELASGAGILASKQPRAWIWGRVAGDALDLATLIPKYNSGNRKQTNAGLAILAVAGVTALDVVCARALSDKRTSERKLVRDYSDRVGLREKPEAMRGRARGAEIPRDMKTPEPLRPRAST